MELSMETTGKILRRSIYTFLQNYQCFTSVAVVLALPFSSSILLSEAFIFLSPTSRSLLQTTYNFLNSLFQSAGFPAVNIFTLKLSQAITSSVFNLPFTLSFFLLSKSLTIQFLDHQENPNSPSPSFSSTLSVYSAILRTHILNSFLLISANSTAFLFSFLGFNLFKAFGFSSPGFLLFLSVVAAVFYSIVLANSLVICNLALVLSGSERGNIKSSSGFSAILKVCSLVGGKIYTAMFLALPISFGQSGIEALFRYRITRPCYSGERLMMTSSVALEATLIAYLYALSVVLDTVISFVFLNLCKKTHRNNGNKEIDIVSDWVDKESFVIYTDMESLEEIILWR